jgi:predicted acyltransferase
MPSGLDLASTLSTPSHPAVSRRVMSVDALRGFDMFWILGADSLVGGLRRLSDHPAVVTVADQLEHVPWHCFHFYDLIFPLFVFLMGVSTVFSLGRLQTTGNKREAYTRLLWRSVLLIALGIFYYGALSRDGGPEQYRLVGVLQRIGIAYLGCGLIFLNFRLKGIVLSLLLVLLGYWVLLTFVPVPVHGAGNYEEGKNLTNYIDSKYLPGYKWDGDWDPEGLLSNLPAVATALLGLLAGMVISQEARSGITKVGWLLALGLACLSLGWLWGWSFPINKKLWTSSFVLFAGGWSFLLLALFYWIIDVRKLVWWAQPLVWIGMNPITLYVLGRLVGGYRSLAQRVLLQPTVDALGVYGPLVLALVGLLFAVGLAHWLYRRQIFVRL